MQDVKLAKKLKKLRMDSGVSQSNLAKKIGCSKQALSLIESGKRRLSIKRAFAIAKALNYEMVINLHEKTQR